MLRELKQKDYNAVLLDISFAHLPQFFRSCQEVGFYGEGRHFFITNLNFRAKQEDPPTASPSTETLENVGDVNISVSASSAQDEASSPFIEDILPHLKSFTFFRILDQDHPLAVDLSRRIRQKQRQPTRWPKHKNKNRKSSRKGNERG